MSLVLFSYQQVYAGKIYRNVYFGELDLSGKTKKQAEYLIENKFQELLKKDLVISANSKTVSAKFEDTGLTFDVQKTAEKCYDIGRGRSFILNLRTSFESMYHKIPIEAEPYINENKYDNFIKIAIGQLNNDPVDATLKINNGKIILTDSKEGHIADTSDLTSQIISLAENDKNKISLAVKSSKAKIVNADFDSAKNQAEGYLSKTYTFSYQEKQYSPSQSEVGNWINFNLVNGKYMAELNQSNIKAYLNKIAKNFEILTIDKRINATNGDVIEKGRKGKYLDKDNALNSLLDQINENYITVTLLTYEEQPKEIKVFPAEGLVTGRFEGKYIDIDLTKQKLCQIEGKNVLGCYTVSSGKPSMPTPTGTFHIQEKKDKAWSAEYGLYMPYWEQFNGPYGIHELPEWPNGYKEGEDHLGIPVSHGCVRLGVGAAATVYRWTEIGTPVYIHK